MTAICSSLLPALQFSLPAPAPGPDSCLLLPDFTSADFLNILGVLYGGPTRLVSTSPHFNPYFSSSQTFILFYFSPPFLLLFYSPLHFPYSPILLSPSPPIFLFTSPPFSLSILGPGTSHLVKLKDSTACWWPWVSLQ